MSDYRTESSFGTEKSLGAKPAQSRKCTFHRKTRNHSRTLWSSNLLLFLGHFLYFMVNITPRTITGMESQKQDRWLIHVWVLFILTKSSEWEVGGLDSVCPFLYLGITIIPESLFLFFFFFYIFILLIIYLFGCARSWLRHLESFFFVAACEI